ncbi:hypothetical protein A0E43_18545 [Pectobacterium cacticida]
MRHSPFFTAVYDACVLYPSPLRDFLMWLGLFGRFRARWDQAIHDERKRNLLDLHAATVASAAQAQRALVKNLPTDTDRYLEILLRQYLVQTTKVLTTYRTIL